MRQPVTHAKRAGAGPPYVRTPRPGPVPRPGFVTGCAALAGLGFGTVGRLRPGTRVAIEGPYGAFTRHAGLYDRVVLIGAGVGITPLRALLEVYVCGPDQFSADVVSAASRLGVAGEQIHREAFGF